MRPWQFGHQRAIPSTSRSFQNWSKKWELTRSTWMCQRTWGANSISRTHLRWNPRWWWWILACCWRFWSCQGCCKVEDIGSRHRLVEKRRTPDPSLREPLDGESTSERRNQITIARHEYHLIAVAIIQSDLRSINHFLRRLYILRCISHDFRFVVAANNFHGEIFSTRDFLYPKKKTPVYADTICT